MESSLVLSGAAKPSVVRVAAICGSLSKTSRNRGIIRAASKMCEEAIQGIHIEYVDIETLPFMNIDLEVGGVFPPAVEHFRQKILAADCVFFASPEYNYSISGVMKNALDWGSRHPNVWADKAAAVASAGGDFGGGRSQNHLRQIGVFLDLHFINKPELFIFAFHPPRKFDSQGNLIHPESLEKLQELLLSLRTFALRLKGGERKEERCFLQLSEQKREENTDRRNTSFVNELEKENGEMKKRKNSTI